MSEQDYRPLTNIERVALQQRTARSVRLLWSFQGMPVQVGEPCPKCGALFYWITGKEHIAPTGYCLNCRPGEIESRPALRKLVADSALDTLAEEAAVFPEEDSSDEDMPPDLADQLTLF